jgi:hypothetical protein
MTNIVVHDSQGNIYNADLEVYRQAQTRLVHISLIVHDKEGGMKASIILGPNAVGEIVHGIAELVKGI